MLDTAETIATNNAVTWPASLSLDFEHNARGTRLVRSRHTGPLYVQKPFYPEGVDLAHVYLLHPPGGMVSGDDLNIEINTSPRAQVLVTTPGAGRVYGARMDKRLQRQRVLINVAENASLEWLPLESIAYPGANGQLTVTVEVAAGGHFIGWDVLSLGLPAAGRVFDHGSLKQRFSVRYKNQWALIEKIQLQREQDLSAITGLRGLPILGFLVAGPVAGIDDEILNAILQSCRQHCAELQSPEAIAAITQVGDFLVARYLGGSSAQARALFIKLLSLVRPPLLGRKICLPRIWAT